MDCGRSSSLDNRKESESLPRHQTPWGDILPYEVILRIMQFVVRSEGPLPFLERLAIRQEIIVLLCI